VRSITMLATPFFLVDDVAESIAYWRDSLGFYLRRSLGEPLEFAILQRNTVRVMLRRAPRWSQTIARSNSQRAEDAIDLYISVSDVSLLTAELTTSGADVIQVPSLAEGRPELLVRDPNGYVLCFGEEQHWPY